MSILCFRHLWTQKSSVMSIDALWYKNKCWLNSKTYSCIVGNNFTGECCNTWLD